MKQNRWLRRWLDEQEGWLKVSTPRSRAVDDLLLLGPQNRVEWVWAILRDRRTARGLVLRRLLSTQLFWKLGTLQVYAATGGVERRQASALRWVCTRPVGVAPRISAIL